jgi:hypothetical protein
MLATAGRDGATQPLLCTHGFSAAMIARLVSRGLATLTYEKVRAGSKLVDVAWVQVTDAGRKAIADDGIGGTAKRRLLGCLFCISSATVAVLGLRFCSSMTWEATPAEVDRQVFNPLIDAIAQIAAGYKSSRGGCLKTIDVLDRYGASD